MRKVFANKIIYKYEPIQIHVTEITLLSWEEYNMCKDEILGRFEWWWLRSSIKPLGFVTNVCNDGTIDCTRVDHEYTDVRPALVLANFNSLNLEAEDKLEFAGYQWTVLSCGKLLCDESVGKTCFRKDWKAEDSNNYEKSDIKIWLSDWAKKVGIK